MMVILNVPDGSNEKALSKILSDVTGNKVKPKRIQKSIWTEGEIKLCHMLLEIHFVFTAI